MRCAWCVEISLRTSHSALRTNREKFMTTATSNDNIELLRMTTAGSVDDGKSTLIGQLLYGCNAIYEDQFAAVEKTSKKKGMNEADLALLLDGLSSEREQGITIDVAYRYFSTPKRRFIVMDVPGHEQYTRNMITGASNANLAMILIDARKGLIKQSKRHLFIATLLGIPHIAIVVNKMDAVDFDQAVFEKIKSDISMYAAKLNLKDLQFIPISALKGDNVTKKSEQMKWFTGDTVLGYLENLQITIDRNLIDFRFPIQYVIRPNQDFRGYAGMIEGGVIKKGQKVTILPSGRKSRIKSIYIGEKERDYGFNPESALLTLEDEIDAGRGDMIVREDNTPEVSKEFEAMVAWFSETPLEKDRSYILKHTTKETRCFVTEVGYRMNIDDLHREEADHLEFNEMGRLSIKTSEPIMIDPYSNNRSTGSFILVDEFTNNTVAAGIIVEKKKADELDLKNGQLKVEKGAILWFTGLSGSGKSTIADKIHHLLQKNKVASERLDGDLLRDNLCKDLGFSKEDRLENIERAAFLAKMLSRHGVITIASFISPDKAQRDRLKQSMENFVEIHVSTPLEICEKRDVKGLYKKARAGEIGQFTGISDSYEAPTTPHLELKTDQETEEESAEKVMQYLIKNGFLIQE